MTKMEEDNFTADGSVAGNECQTKRAPQVPHSQSGMSLVAIMGFLTLAAIAMLAVAPTIQQGVQREKELESIRRGEEVAEAIRQYVTYYQGAKLPSSMDDLLEGLPSGTKKRQILRASAAVDPLSEDGKWRLIEANAKAFQNFGRRVQNYNNGLLPNSPEPTNIWGRYLAQGLVNVTDAESVADLDEDSDAEIEIKTDKVPFIGVASQSRSRSVIAYYGIGNHSKWIFTPLFRGSGSSPALGGGGFNSGGQSPPVKNNTRLEP